jgi:hypothetical protein
VDRLATVLHHRLHDLRGIQGHVDSYR